MVELPQGPSPRKLAAGQRTAIWIADAATGESRLVYETRDVLLEAPNWSLDGKYLFLNGDGGLWRYSLATSSIDRIPYQDLPNINNDHVLDPNGTHIFLSANDWSLYRASLEGGPVTKITTAPFGPVMHFLHGVSPSGDELAFIGLEADEKGNWRSQANVFTVKVDGTGYKKLTHGTAPADGSEYSPDGQFLYFNTEQFDGHAQCARMKRDGTQVEQLTFDSKVNWFPHLPLEGPYAVYLAFPTGTLGHPPDVWVDIMLVKDGEWRKAKPIAHVFGGQGTMNVNSWAPDGKSFAYVSLDRQ
ncbi:periplasmic component of the Tol biopolymer transport system [Meredithblackwellia eburnea MCA 4105]